MVQAEVKTGKDEASRSAVRDCLYGLAAGERNGGPIRMALRLGASLHACGGFDAEDVFARYHDWWLNGAFDTGNVFMHVMALADRGFSAGEAAGLAHQKLDGQTAGVNAAHRIAPLACYLPISDAELPRLARLEAALTHHHELAGEASAFVAVLLRALLRGEALPAAVERARQQASTELLEVLDSGNLPFEENGFAPMILANALHFVLQATDFDSALEPALAHAGGANYSPVLVGAIAGAAFGDVPRGLVVAVHGETVVHELDTLIEQLA